MELGNQTAAENNDNDDSSERGNEIPDGLDQNRIHISPVPKFFGFKQFKKLLEKHLSGINIGKIRQMKFDAYVTFKSAEDAQQAILKLNGLAVKKAVLKAQLAQTDRKTFLPEHAQPGKAKTARESVTKLADLPYNEQLSQKTKTSLRACERLLAEMKKANVDYVNQLHPAELLKQTAFFYFFNLTVQIKPSPITTGYRNKCEFTIGLTCEKKVCVGFVGGRFSNNEHYIIPIDDVDNITEMTKKIVKAVTNFVQASGLPPFDEFSRVGVWKMLTVRHFGGDVMLILTVNPLEDRVEEEKLKQNFCSRFLNSSTFLEDGFRVTSLYWHSLANCSDVTDYEHIGGTPYIYETVLGCRFRVSPSAFFQTNSRAAAVLYNTVGKESYLPRERLLLVSSQSGVRITELAQNYLDVKVREASGLATSRQQSMDCDEEDSEVPPKRLKLDESSSETVKIEGTDGKDEPLRSEAQNSTKARPTILLDICCGTGTIGQCVLKEFKKDNDVRIFAILHVVEAAIMDAKENAKGNGMGNDVCCYFAGKAEEVFPSLRFSLPPGVNLVHSNVVGVLDPPRCGVHDKVVLGCRMMETLRRLVFVSCDPAAAMKNIVDLCRPTSKKYAGRPFKIVSITPVDMFPQTPHIEWVVTMER
ncbi:unnamed protein product [Haemonchus placei]|uniref:tRNA (uracil(54)-C(5))-methyltransferase n=1 Tax=Haemonchus placei TaxID=6290 RepID=A0A0N4W3V2_HAEPC|nr:unnamed protein product [Haemonchus placei]